LPRTVAPGSGVVEGIADGAAEGACVAFGVAVGDGDGEGETTGLIGTVGAQPAPIARAIAGTRMRAERVPIMWTCLCSMVLLLPLYPSKQATPGFMSGFSS
jgi:hypothetical protein